MHFVYENKILKKYQRKKRKNNQINRKTFFFCNHTLISCRYTNILFKFQENKKKIINCKKLYRYATSKKHTNDSRCKMRFQRLYCKKITSGVFYIYFYFFPDVKMRLRAYSSICNKHNYCRQTKQRRASIFFLCSIIIFFFQVNSFIEIQ